MKLFDVNGNPLETFDPEQGYVVEEQRIAVHHEAIPGRAEQGHYEVAREYPNGGRDLRFVVDVPGVKGAEPWDEYETVLVFHAFAPEREDDSPTQLDMLEAQVMYTALMTDTLLEG